MAGGASAPSETAAGPRCPADLGRWRQRGGRGRFLERTEAKAVFPSVSSFKIVSGSQCVCRALFAWSRLQNKDTPLIKDLAHDLLREASVESGLTVGNISGIGDGVPDRWCFLSRHLCHLQVK